MNRIRNSAALLLAAAALLASSVAYPQTAPRWNEDLLQWTASTSCVGGAPRTDCPGTGFRIERASTPGATTWTFLASPAASASSYLVTGLTAGQNCYRIREDSASGSSDFTAAVCKTTVAPVPNPPTIVTVDQVAYNAKPDADRLAYTKRQVVGTVALSTPCDTSRPIADGLYAVDRTAVRWSSWRRTERPVVKCGPSDAVAQTASLALTVD